MYVDGNLVLSVDNHQVFDSAPPVRPSNFAVPVSPGTVHRLKIVVLGSGAAPASSCAIDGFTTT